MNDLDAVLIREEKWITKKALDRISQNRLKNSGFLRSTPWSNKKQSGFIESLLMRIPVSPFYMFEDKEGALIVVDGRQRLITLTRFLSNNLELYLDNRDLNEKTFEQLEPRLQNRIEDYQFLFYIIDHCVPKQLRISVIERVTQKFYPEPL